MVGGAVLRAVRLVVSKWDQPLGLNDSLYYSAQARQLAHGVWFREAFADQPGAEHGPLTSTLMAVVSWGNDPINRQRMVTVACGIATVAVIGIVARRVAGNRAGLIAAGIAAVYPNLWLNDGLVMSESVSCLLISLALWALLTWSDKPTLARGNVRRHRRRSRHVGAQRVGAVRARRRSGDVADRREVRPRSGVKRWTHIVTAAGVAVAAAAAVGGLQRRPLRSPGAVDDERGTVVAGCQLRRDLLRPCTGWLVAVLRRQ